MSNDWRLQTYFHYGWKIVSTIGCIYSTDTFDEGAEGILGQRQSEKSLINQKDKFAYYQ